MPLHPQVAAFAAQLDDLSALLRAQGDRRWSDRIDLCRGLVADSNFAGVERFLALFEGPDSLADLRFGDPEADARLADCLSAARSFAERLASEERDAKGD